MAIINQVLSDRQYGIIDYADGVVLLKKAALSSNQALADWLAYQKQLKATNQP